MSSRPRRCGGLRSDGTPCRAWAVRGSDPPRCRAHRRQVSGPIAPTAEVDVLDALPGEVPITIEAVVADLATKQTHLSAYIDRCIAQGIDVPDLLRLFALHGQNASRLGRLLRDQFAIEGDAGDELAEALSLALDEVAEQLRLEWA